MTATHIYSILLTASLAEHAYRLLRGNSATIAVASMDSPAVAKERQY